MRVLQGCVMALSWSELGALSAEAVAEAETTCAWSILITATKH